MSQTYENQSFPPGMQFPEGSIFINCSFQHSTRFGEGCVFYRCKLEGYRDQWGNIYWVYTGKGNVFSENCTFKLVWFGDENVVGRPMIETDINKRGSPGNYAGDGKLRHVHVFRQSSHPCENETEVENGNKTEKKICVPGQNTIWKDGDVGDTTAERGRSDPNELDGEM